MSEFQDYRFPITQQGMIVTTVAAGANIDFGPVPPGHLWAINNIACWNEDNNTDTARCSIIGFGEDHHLIDIIDLADGQVYSVHGTYYVPEGRSLRVRFIATQIGDTLHAYLSGFDVIQPTGAKHA